MRESIGHYRILEKLGQGGMGEVWKAVDTKLDRAVALKILPPDKVADPDRKRRFVLEAKAASALNHPHIVTIYEIASDDGLDYIAMEYVPGKTLEHYIGRSGAPLKQAIDWAIQIASALGRAHSKAIVHRDVKPGNVMVSEEGGVKVLDFGLSKLLETVALGDQSATATILDGPKTEEGKLVGTIAYMSPEQAEGRPVDARSDIFSFGALLYELFTGRRPFTGASKASILASLLREEPAAISTVTPQLPRDLERLIERCLRKDPGRRYQHMDDVRIALEDLKAESESGIAPALAPRSRRRVWPWIVAAGLGIAAVAIATTLWMRRPATPDIGPALTRLTHDSGLTTDPALSPDGRLVAYASDRAGDGGLDIWVQQLAGGDAIRITNRPEDESEPQFSPDGTRIVYHSEAAGGGIYSVSTLGGQPRLLIPNGRGARCSPDGRQIVFWIGNPTSGSPFAPGSTSIWTAPPEGGEPRRLAGDFDVAVKPEWAGDGKHVVFLGITKGGALRDIFVAPVDGGSPVATGLHDLLEQQKLRPATSYFGLVRGSSDAYYLPLSMNGAQNLWALNLSPATWKAAGMRRVTSGTEAEVRPSVAGDRMAFAGETESIQLWSVNLDAHGQVSGPPEQLTHGADAVIPEFSRDGKKLLYLNPQAGAEYRAVVRDLASGAETVAASAPAIHHPTLSPDGSRVAYRIRAGDNWDTVVVGSGGGLPRKICGDCGMTMSWTNDGRQILVKKGSGIALVDVATASQQMLLQHPKHVLWQAHVSPDGHWVTFLTAVDEGHKSINVAAFRPDVKPEEWITIAPEDADNDKPRWSPDGRSIYFTSARDGFRCIWAQRLNPATKRPVGEPQAVMHFHSTVRSLSNMPLYPLELSIAPGRLVFVLSERHGNIWMTQAR